MGDTIGICVSEGVGTDEKFNNRLWRKPPKLCCRECEEFFRQVMERNWVCPFCKTRIQTK
jgi:Zn finger protein HypA/HybF involved in hydrogenase expression